MYVGGDSDYVLRYKRFKSFNQELSYYNLPKSGVCLLVCWFRVCPVDDWSKGDFIWVISFIVAVAFFAAGQLALWPRAECCPTRAVATGGALWPRAERCRAIAMRRPHSRCAHGRSDHYYTIGVNSFQMCLFTHLYFVYKFIATTSSYNLPNSGFLSAALRSNAPIMFYVGLLFFFYSPFVLRNYSTDSHKISRNCVF